MGDDDVGNPPPTLDPAMQATRLVAPVTKWGSIARSSPMGGTYHFYTDDYKFSALRARPAQVPASGCRVAVEANFTTFEGQPPELAVADIRRKREYAVAWQRAGVRMIVDLNVHPDFREANLAGVPRGWSAYATRSHWLNAWSEIEANYRTAVEHAGGPPALFVLFGGGKAARAYCEARGWTHVHEHIHTATGRHAAHGVE